MRARIFVLVSVLFLQAPPVRAYVPEETPTRRIEGTGRALLTDRAVSSSRAGVLLLRGGRTVLSVNADDVFRPASVIKLFTTTAAITRFGPDHRFATRVLRRGHDLYLIGGGDPTLATEAYRRRRFLPKPTDAIKRPAFTEASPTMEDLAAAVARTGVRRVSRVVGDERLFDTVRTQQGWPARYLGRDPLTGLLGALSVNEGRADLKGLVLEKDPPRSAVNAFVAALRARGITVGAGSVGSAPAAAKEIARVSSPPLAEIVDFVNRYSINYAAELLLKHLGARANGRGTTAGGVAEVRSVMAELKVPTAGLRMGDGSGLSSVNLVTPTSVARLLAVILAGSGPGFAALRGSIPTAGGPGTLLRRSGPGPARGNLFAKTGTVRTVRAFAGWVTPTGGQPVVFVLLFNSTGNVAAFNAPFDLFGAALASI